MLLGRMESGPAMPAPVPGAIPIRVICRALEREYGSPRHGNPTDPLDDLVYIILSTRTQDRRFGELFRAVRAKFPTWETLTPERLTDLERILAPGGLGRLKARQLLSIMVRLRADFGSTTLAPVSEMADGDAERYLTSLWGVSLKVAKCVMMYTLGRQVLPVDIHVHRVAGRLGLRVKKRPDTSQEWIEAAVPPAQRYGFHVTAVAHGRAVCRPVGPRCEKCCVAKWCRYYRELEKADSG